MCKNNSLSNPLEFSYAMCNFRIPFPYRDLSLCLSYAKISFTLRSHPLRNEIKQQNYTLCIITERSDCHKEEGVAHACDEGKGKEIYYY